MAATPPIQDRLIHTLKKLEGDKIAIINKINTLEAESKEHKLVLDVFETVPLERKCFRMVGEVLVPRTVGEVKPALAANNQKICELLTKLKEDLECITKQHAEVASKLEPILTKLATPDDTKQTGEGKTNKTSGGGVLV